MMMLLVSIFLTTLSFLDLVQGHGHLTTPRSRNWVASPQQEGTWNSIPGVPAAESCPHCLNRKLPDRLCGIGNAGDYDEWLDSSGVPMAWQSQGVLRLGEEFDVTAFLDTNHAGHMELKICKYDDPNMALNQACLDAHPLEFVQDLSYGIPKDSNHPERAYFADVGSQSTFNFKFKIPESYTDIIGEKVLMQWRYITANSCQPQGYKNSDISNFLLSKGWLRSGGNLADCVEPYEPDGARTSTSPEQFWNCAEVTVLAAGPVAPSTPSPVAQPSPPVSSPVSQPVSEPVSQPTSQPVVAPTTNTQGYCNYGPDGTGATSTCNGQVQGGDWCNQMESQCAMCNGKWCTNGTSNPPPPPAPTPPSPAPPTGLPAGYATTTRYWDCSGGACGCAYLANGEPGKETHCHSNAMFEAPTANPYGAKYYGTAAVSPALFNQNDHSVTWLGEGCGKCWKVTGTANIPGYDTSTTTTVVLKGVNLCPADSNSYWCGNGKVHFDIAAPGFDVLQYSASNTCQDREPAEINGFTACEGWPGQSCDCSKFNDPVLRAGCENFISLMWDNAQVAYEEVPCPFELDRLNCWEENGGAYPFGIPEFCASNVEESNPSPPVTATPTSRPSLRNTSAPTASPTKFPVSVPTGTESPTQSPVSSNGSKCCSWNNFNCGSDVWCNNSETNCVNFCNGSWISTSPPSNCRLSKWSECTNDPTGCCGSACSGKAGDYYRQCL